MSRKPIFLCCSLDVEEEGLFSGRYQVTTPPISNVATLALLDSFLEAGVKPTLFCAYSVFAQDNAWQYVAPLAENPNVEIGLHLHHWNTPPLLYQTDYLHKVPSFAVPTSMLQQKLIALASLATRRLGRPATSFRMGKWDLHQRDWPLLAHIGILSDASVRPYHAGRPSSLLPNHFYAPNAPYYVQVGKHTIFEVPLTATPISCTLARSLKSSLAMQASFHQWGALVLLPVEHPLWAMKLITRLSIQRGSPVISLTWHSSEMQPNGNPKLATQTQVDSFLAKLHAYIGWLKAHYQVRCVTIDELRQLWPEQEALTAPIDEDWAAFTSTPR